MISIAASWEQEYRKQLEKDLKDPGYGERVRQQRREDKLLNRMASELSYRANNQAYDKMRQAFLDKDEP